MGKFSVSPLLNILLNRMPGILVPLVCSGQTDLLASGANRQEALETLDPEQGILKRSYAGNQLSARYRDERDSNGKKHEVNHHGLQTKFPHQFQERSIGKRNADTPADMSRIKCVPRMTGKTDWFHPQWSHVPKQTVVALTQNFEFFGASVLKPGERPTLPGIGSVLGPDRFHARHVNPDSPLIGEHFREQSSHVRVVDHSQPQTTRGRHVPQLIVQKRVRGTAFCNPHIHAPLIEIPFPHDVDSLEERTPYLRGEITVLFVEAPEVEPKRADGQQRKQEYKKQKKLERLSLRPVPHSLLDLCPGWDCAQPGQLSEFVALAGRARSTPSRVLRRKAASRACVLLQLNT
jgi:hypothetical protein